MGVSDHEDKQHEIDMPNVNPNANVNQLDHIPTLALGLTLGWTGLAMGMRGFLDTNMLVSVSKNARARE